MAEIFEFFQKMFYFLLFTPIRIFQSLLELKVSMIAHHGIAPKKKLVHFFLCFRTKALVLELLAAICLVKGGHEIILFAFDNFKEVCSERRRFTTLMAYFTQYDSFHIEFMVACMQFVNIVVHSVDDMNFRVHLQYEFTKLGLDEYLEKLRHTESEDLQVNMFLYRNV